MGYPSAEEGNFGFGFNDVVFSDRVLRLEITPLASGTDSERGSTGFKVITLHISSILLAAKSPFFYKLLKNSMSESQQKDDVTLRINASEEAPLMELLNFIYGNPLSATSAPDLVDVLMAADKFELPSNVLEAEVVQPLINTAKQYLAAHYRDFTKSREEAAMALPLSALEVVLGSNGLKVNSEDVVFDFVMKWARVHYPKLEERREILTKKLMRFICFSNLSILKLNELVDCPDFNFPRRVYNYRRIRVEPLESIRPRCAVYFDITKQECLSLFSSSDRICTEPFYLGGRRFSLFAKCNKEPQKSYYKFCLFVEMAGSQSCTLDFDDAVMKKPLKEFKIQATNYCNLTDAIKARGAILFERTNVLSDESIYFIDGILHLRAQITINN